jgi:hypothetical protein
VSFFTRLESVLSQHFMVTRAHMLLTSWRVLIEGFLAGFGHSWSCTALISRMVSELWIVNNLKGNNHGIIWGTVPVSAKVGIQEDKTVNMAGLRPRYAAACLLRSWVRIPPGAWIFVGYECCVLSGRGLCDELITCPEESYRLWCVVVCDLENLKNEEAMTRVGSQRHSKKKPCIWLHSGMWHLVQYVLMFQKKIEPPSSGGFIQLPE